jgi:23S rRNA (cytidine2498-2'-O)-methyltransferase
MADLVSPAAGAPEPGETYSHLILESPVAVEGHSVNALARAIFDHFSASIRDERIEASWPCVFACAAAPDGLGARMRAVDNTFARIMNQKLGRLAKLASPGIPRGLGETRGLFVWLTDFGTAYVARTARRHGQRRMADDALAPSRSYLKVEEAYGIIGREPMPTEAVCDLGAAPGGWSYSAAKRGAQVVAVDNGPMKGGALGHPKIKHLTDDAFRYGPPPGASFDWLFCDMVEEPHHVLRSIVEPWLSRQWCRRFVVNFKLGRVEPISLLQELRAAESPLVRHATGVLIRHLYHDRDEVTVVGEVKS